MTTERKRNKLRANKYNLNWTHWYQICGQSALRQMFRQESMSNHKSWKPKRENKRGSKGFCGCAKLKGVLEIKGVYFFVEIIAVVLFYEISITEIRIKNTHGFIGCWKSPHDNWFSLMVPSPPKLKGTGKSPQAWMNEIQGFHRHRIWLKTQTNWMIWSLWPTIISSFALTVLINMNLLINFRAYGIWI